MDIFTAVVDSSSVSETRPELSGILINFDSEKIEGAATDSFRLAERNILKKTGISDQSVIIPRSTVQELIRIFSGYENEISLTISENQIFFSTEDLEVVSRLIDGSYPDYKKVIPDKFISRVLVSKSELENNIRLASIFSSHISDVKIKAEENNLKIIAKNPDRGEIFSNMAAFLKNEPFEVSVNYRYLLDGLKIIPTDRVSIEFTGEGNPLVLKPEEGKNFIYIIMPLRS